MFLLAEIMFAENEKKTEVHHIKQNKIGSERGMLCFLIYIKSIL